jgi:hypothetical protein
MRFIRYTLLSLLVTIVIVVFISLFWKERIAQGVLAWAGIQHMEIDLVGGNSNALRIGTLAATLDHASGPISVKVADAICRYRIIDVLRGQLDDCAAASVDITLPPAGVVNNEASNMVLPDLAGLMERLHRPRLPVRQVKIARLMIQRGPASAKKQASFSLDLTTTEKEHQLRLDSTQAGASPPLKVRAVMTDDRVAGSLHLDFAQLNAIVPGVTSGLPLHGIIKAELQADRHPAAKVPLHFTCTVSTLQHALFSAEEIRLQLSSTQPLSATSLILAPSSRLSLRKAHIQNMGVAAIVADLTGSFTFDNNSWRMELQPVVPWSVEGATFGAVRLTPMLFKDLSMQLFADRNQLRGSSTFAAPQGAGTIAAAFNHRLTDEPGGHFSLSTATPLQMSESSNVLHLLAHPKLPFALQNGALTFSVHADWKQAVPANLQTAIDFTGGQGTFGDALFSGLTLRHHLRLLPVLESMAPGLVQLTEMGGPLPLNDLVIKTSVHPSSHGKQPAVTIEQASVRLFDGSMRLEPCTYDGNSPAETCLLQLDNLDLQALIALHQVDGLTVNGRVHGQLPLQFSPQGIAIHQGRLENVAGGGIIRYQPGAGAMHDSPLTAYAIKALKDLRYHRLLALVDYLPDGTLTVGVQLQGKNPHLEADRPIHLNITTEQNLLSLLKSVQYSHGLTSELDRKIRQQP